MKRLISLFLSLALCLTIFPTTAFAAISTEDLYLQYPYYIATNSEYNNLEWDSFQICIDILNSQDKFGKYEALVATLVDDGTSIASQELLSKLGWGSSYAESIQESATEKFLAAISAENSQSNMFVKEALDSTQEWIRVYNDFTDPFRSEAELARFLTEFLISIGVDSKNADALKKLFIDTFPTLLKSTSSALSAQKTVLSIAALYEFDLKNVRILMEHVDKNSTLYQGLETLLSKMMDPERFIVDRYLRKTVLKQIEKLITDFLPEPNYAYKLAKSLYFGYVYDGYKVDEYSEAVYLLAYTNDIDAAKNNLELEFLSGTATKADIQTHKDLVELSNIAQIASLNAFAGLLSVRNRYDLKMKAEDQVALLLWNHSYDWFMKECKKDLDADLATGNAVKGTAKDRQNQTDENQPQPSTQPQSPSKPSSPSASATKPSIVQTVHCFTYITCPQRVVNLYLNPGDTSRYDYFSQGQNTRSSTYVKMSDGSTWYSVYVSSGGKSMDLWLKAEADISLNPAHTFGELQYETAHPHKGYHTCECGYIEYTAALQSEPDSCTQCKATSHSTHTWDSGAITKAPTISNTGIKTYTCTVCKTEKTETLPKLNGTSGLGSNNLEWTFTKDGVLSVFTDWYEFYSMILNTEDTEYIKDNTNTIIVEEGIASMGTGAIVDWPSLTHISLPESLTTIRSRSIRECPLVKSVYFPAGLSTIDKNFGHVMYNCPKLENIYVSKDNPTYCSLDGVVYSKDMKEIVLIPTGKTSITIPKSVTSISQYAIPYDHQLTTINYEGSAEQWKSIKISGNNPSLAIRINYNYNATGFKDVALSSYYANPVIWAVKNGITSGTSTTTFSPNVTCTNAQILTFLWRANGSPEPKISNPFSNLTQDKYYYKAALWAYSNNMISGNTFDADTPCTRSRTVTYLWKCAGKPNSSKNTVFTDVSSSSDYAKAVSWAVNEGITAGTSQTTFSPNLTCTRAQIVTFLYRYLGS